MNFLNIELKFDYFVLCIHVTHTLREIGSIFIIRTRINHIFLIVNLFYHPQVDQMIAFSEVTGDLSQWIEAYRSKGVNWKGGVHAVSTIAVAPVSFIDWP